MAKSEKNYGVSLLKTMMCFEVLACHFLPYNDALIWQQPIHMLKTSAVPVFMLLSFLLCRGAVESGNPEALKKRLKRLLWPHISWALVYYVGCLLLSFINGEGFIGMDCLIWQLVTGSNERLNPAMWFQVDLIVLTAVFSLLFFRVNRRVGEEILLLTGAACLVLQYSKINFCLFEPLPDAVKYSLGRIVEVWPQAVAGVCLFRPGLLEWMKKHWVLGGFGSVCLCAAALAVKRICTIYDSFGYGGIHVLLVAVGMAGLFWCLPLERLGGRMTGLIDRLSRYTLGIYCEHLLVAKVFDAVLRRVGIPGEGFWFCVAVFAASYLVSCLLERSGKRWLVAMVR